eukprot:1647322-Prymnesium_polylepis.1
MSSWLSPDTSLGEHVDLHDELERVDRADCGWRELSQLEVQGRIVNHSVEGGAATFVCTQLSPDPVRAVAKQAADDGPEAAVRGSDPCELAR